MPLPPNLTALYELSINHQFTGEYFGRSEAFSPLVSHPRIVDPQNVVENMLGVVFQSHNTEQMLDALRKKMAESCAPSKGHDSDVS